MTSKLLNIKNIIMPKMYQEKYSELTFTYYEKKAVTISK